MCIIILAEHFQISVAITDIYFIASEEVENFKDISRIPLLIFIVVTMQIYSFKIEAEQILQKKSFFHS